MYERNKIIIAEVFIDDAQNKSNNRLFKTK
jgi:hypothetical protein